MHIVLAESAAVIFKVKPFKKSMCITNPSKTSDFRDKLFHIFLCFHQLLHLIPYLAVGIILMPFDSYACSYKNRSCHMCNSSCFV